MTFRKILSVLLAAAMLSCLAACGETRPADPGAVTSENPAADGSGSEDGGAAETEADVLAPYKSIDLGGRTVTISVSSNISENGGGMPSSYPYIAGPEALTGESVPANVYARNHKVEELLSCKLNYVPLDLNYDQVQPHIAQQVIAGDTGVDCYVNDQLGLLYCAMNAYLLDLADKANFTEYRFDFDSGAFYAEYMKNLSLGAQRYLMTGDYFIDTLRAAHVLYLNKHICQDVTGSPDSVYDMVKDGSWTLDRFNGLVESAYSDTNGDSQADDEDRYGLSGHSKGWSAPYYSFYYSTDSHVVDFDADGMPYLNEANVARMSTAAEKLIALDQSVGMYKTSSVAESLKKFVDGQSMFTMFQKVGDIEQASIRDFDGMGVVPYPKLDESQADYRTLVHDTAEMGAVPSTAAGEAASAVSAVIQVMATHAHAYLLNDYYEVALKNKYAQDRTSADMLDIVVKGISAPFEFAYELGFGDASYLAGITWNPVGDSITQGSDVTASGFQTRLKPANKKLAKLIAAYQGEG